jgi:hypothetical protein
MWALGLPQLDEGVLGYPGKHAALCSTSSRCPTLLG